MDKPHFFQMQILRELLFKPQSRFTDLNISGLTSDHFTYYIKPLVKQGLVIKINTGKYSLSPKGKELANTMDTEALVIEKQSKLISYIILEKEVDGERYLLTQKRLKEPFFGFVGFPTGKIPYGESIFETAKREALEEANLTADFELRYLLKIRIYNKKQELLEDKVFHVMRGTNVTGELKDFQGGEHKWVARSDFKTLENKYPDLDQILDWYDNPPKSFYVELDEVVETF